MGRFDGVILTSKGLRLQAKAQTGIPLVIKSVVVGDGYLPEGTDVIQMTALINPVADAHTDIIDNTVTGDGFARLEARISSGNTAFFLREIGIIATDPDEGDVLYAYANAGDYADFIPAIMEGDTKQDITIITAIGNVSDVEANITLEAGVGRAEFNECKEEINAKIENEVNKKLDAVFVKALPTSYVEYTFDDDTVFNPVERCSVGITSESEEKYLTVTSASNAGNKYGLAQLDFSKISGNATSVIIEMDFRMPGSRWYIGLVDLSKRPGTSHTTTYDDAGVAFHHGTKDGNNYYVNGVIKRGINFLNTWFSCKAVVDIINKTVYYEIRVRSNGTLVLSDTITFADINTAQITGIELYTWTQTSIDVDNVKIAANIGVSENTVYLVGDNGTYDVYIYKDGEPQLIASHDLGLIQYDPDEGGVLVDNAFRVTGTSYLTDVQCSEITMETTKGTRVLTPEVLEKICELAANSTIPTRGILNIHANEIKSNQLVLQGAGGSVNLDSSKLEKLLALIE